MIRILGLAVTLTSTALLAAAALLAADTLDLDADTDRTGTIEGSQAEESAESLKSVILLCNCDDDNQDGAPDNADNIAHLPQDRDDLEPFILRKSSSVLAEAVRLILANFSDDDISETDKVRVFRKDGTEILGPSTGNSYTLTDAEKQQLANGDMVFYAEGLQFATAVRVAVFKGGVEQDALTLEVAPFILTPHNLKANTNLVCHFNHPISDAYVADFKNACVAGNVQAKVIQNGDVWIEDELCWGFTETPRRFLPVALHMLRNRELAADVRRLLAKDLGYFTPFQYLAEGTSLDYGGNLEVTPATDEYPFGRVYYSSIKSQNDPNNIYNRREIDTRFQRFFDRQKIQSPIGLCTDWLGVGHVDEVVSFVPATTTRGFAMLIASPKLGLDILKDLGNSAQLHERYDEEYGSTTVGELLQKRYLLRSFETYNMDIDEKIFGTDHASPSPDSIKSRLVSALSLSPADVHEVPTLFLNVRAGRVWDAAALTPGMVNLSSMGTITLVPEPFLPAFKSSFESTLTRLGRSPRWIDDWYIYHVRLGEVHCGSNVSRSPFSRKWWQ